jgi:hypothetical protein
VGQVARVLRADLQKGDSGMKRSTAFRVKNSSALRAELAMLRARYDGGAVPPPIYAVIKALETALAWHEHRNQ